MCVGASAHYSSSFNPLGPDPGCQLADIQLWALSLDSLVKMLPSWGEDVGVGGGEGVTRSYPWGREMSAKHRDPETAPGFPRYSVQRVGAGVSVPWESGFGA